MLRNFMVTGLVAALMGGFVLAFQSVRPDARPTMGRDEETGALMDRGEVDREMAEPDRRAPMDSPGAPPNGRMPQQPGGAMQQPQPGPMMAQGPAAQPMPMMGMCPMMGMMAGGMNQMNQSGPAQPSQSGGSQAGDLQRAQQELEREFRQLQQELEQLKAARGK